MQYEYHTVILFESKLAQSPVHDAKWPSISSTSSPKNPPFMANYSQASVPSASPAVTPNNNLIIWKSMLIIFNHQTWHPNIPSSSPSMLQKYPAPISDDNAAPGSPWQGSHGQTGEGGRYRISPWDIDWWSGTPAISTLPKVWDQLVWREVGTWDVFFSQRWKGRGKLYGFLICYINLWDISSSQSWPKLILSWWKDMQ